mmetsp:Transcript_9307/g.22428  ORF Transcript_9307/g.22428 Transcript_9307/m.22428 type:complete len:229 (+) Transcript_9307:331-1017(+)
MFQGSRPIFSPTLLMFCIIFTACRIRGAPLRRAPPVRFLGLFLMAFLLLVTLLLLLLLVLLLVPLPQRFLFSLPAASARQRRASAVLGARAAARPGLPACRLGLCPRSQGPLHPLCGGLEGRHRAQRPRSISQASYSLWIVLCHRPRAFTVSRTTTYEKISESHSGPKRYVKTRLTKPTSSISSSSLALTAATSSAREPSSRLFSRVYQKTSLFFCHLPTVALTEAPK